MIIFRDKEYRNMRELLAGVVGSVEREVYWAALEATRWNRAQSARNLGVSYRTLLYKIKDFGFDQPRLPDSNPDVIVGRAKND